MSFSPNTLRYTDITRGIDPEYEEIHKFGTYDNIGGTFVPIARAGVYATPIAATALEIVSTSANDTAAGTGARSITIEGLDGSWLRVNQTIPTNGLTPVPVPIDLIRGFQMYVEDSGTYASQAAPSHVGTITLRGAGVGPTWLQIESTVFPRGHSQCGAYTVPIGKSAIVFPHYISVDSNKTANIIFFNRAETNIVTAPYASMHADFEFVGMTGFNSAIDTTSPQGPFIGPCDIGYMGRFATGTGSISVDFEILLYDSV